MISEKMIEYLMICKIMTDNEVFFTESTDSDTILEMKDRKEKLEKEFIKEYEK